jgi:phage-related protein
MNVKLKLNKLDEMNESIQAELRQAQQRISQIMAEIETKNLKYMEEYIRNMNEIREISKQMEAYFETMEKELAVVMGDNEQQ